MARRDVPVTFVTAGIGSRVDSRHRKGRRGEGEVICVIRKLATGEYRLYSKRKDPRTGKRRNLGTFRTRAGAERHERAIQFFKRRG